MIEVEGGGAGAARQLACQGAVALLGRDPESIWLATTDAGSRVPPQWLVRQLDWAADGYDGVTGLVSVDGWEGWPEGTSTRFESHVLRGGRELGHGHVHGANLGLRARWWLDAGGFPAVPSGEDVELWSAAARAGARLVGVPDITVTTSARARGRATGGFADLLRDLSGLGRRGGE